MSRYVYGKLIKIKGTIILQKLDFSKEVSFDISPIRLWHVRYGNLNFESLFQLQK